MVDGLDSPGPKGKSDIAVIGPLHPVFTARLPQQQVRWPSVSENGTWLKGAQPTSTVKATVRVQEADGQAWVCG